MQKETFWGNAFDRLRRRDWRKLRRRFGGAVVAAIAIVVVIYLLYLVFVPVSDIMAKHDVGTITGPGRAAALQAARDAARNRLLAAGAGLVALAALVYTARTFSLSREGQVTDRFAKAIGQLGDPSLEVRVGAIYALELIVRDSRRNERAVIELLAAFAGERSKAQPLASDQRVPSAKRSGPIMLPDVHDVHVAVAVIGRQRQDRKKKLDLTNTDLAGAHLDWAHLSKADLTGANLRGADLSWANLAHACLTRADLTGARLDHALLRGADLTGANLWGADLEQANLAWADLTGADLRGADLDGAILGSACFRSAHLENVDLTKARVPAADWADADLRGADWLKGSQEPPGWQCDPDGHLTPKSGSDPARAAKE